jgi:hypothetical protein
VDDAFLYSDDRRSFTADICNIAILTILELLDDTTTEQVLKELGRPEFVRSGALDGRRTAQTS